MCNQKAIIFVAKYLDKKEVKGKSILEVGSADINGNLRSLIAHWKPEDYLGTDIEKSINVDMICKAESLANTFGENAFDIVICVDVLEHIQNWREAINNIKKVCKENGIIIISVPDKGLEYHGYPFDFWRYSTKDLEKIFSDCIVENVEQNFNNRIKKTVGSMIRVRKPKKFVERDLSEIKLYSILTEKKQKDITDEDFKTFKYKWLILRKEAKKRFFEIGKKFYYMVH